MFSTSSGLSLEERLPMDVLQMVATHHERADGSGYPQGLENTAISIFGRIAGIVDSEVNEAATHQVSLALLVLDIHQFGRINIKHGYAAGDSTLHAVAKVLGEVRREGDQVARVGDNQFALILPGVLNSGHAELAAHKIQRLLDVPVYLEHDTIHCVADIGIALFPEHARGTDALLAAADEALRRVQ